jgi:toxin-antitoxin system PIN domain toxin
VSAVHLLDVNVLVALFDPDHVHHEVAHDWFADQRKGGWATSPTTENGFVRVLSNPAYGGAVMRASDVVDRLRTFRSSGHHRFWPDTVSLGDDTLFRVAHVRGHRQLTDVYLLGLAVRMKGRLATFDRAIPVDAVAGADTRTIAVIAPDEE